MAHVMILSTIYLFHSIWRTLLFLSLMTFCLGTTAEVMAGVPATAEATTVTEVREATPADMEQLIRTLEDPEKRNALIVQIKALIAAQTQTETAENSGSTGSILVSLSGVLDGVSAMASTMVKTFQASPEAWDWAVDQFGNEDRRVWWIGVLTKFAIILTAGILADLAVRYLICRPRDMLKRKATTSYWGRLPVLIASGGLSLAPVAAFAAAGYAVMPWLSLSDVGRKCALIVVGTSVLARLITLTAQTILRPDDPMGRIVRINSVTARNLMVWVRRFVLVMVYFYFINEIAGELGLPRDFHFIIQRSLGLVSCIMAIIVCLQSRGDIAAYVRKRSETHKSVRLRAVEKTLADIWHIPAIIYFVLTYAVWAFQVPDGFEYIAGASAWTIAIVTGMCVLNKSFHRLGKGPSFFGLERDDGVPQIGRRVERYLPVLRFIGRFFLIGMTVVLIVQAWGIGLLVWLFGTETGRRIPVAILTIVSVLIVAMIIWEMVSILIERYLAETGRQGRDVRRDARLRTLLPMVRNALLIVLLITVGMIVLSELGVNIAPLLAGAGVIGLAVGFGAQTLVKDVITGVFILLEDVVSVGDVVTLGGFTGTVESLSIRALRLRDTQGNMQMIPFSAVDSVVNMGRDYAYVTLDIRVNYHEDTDKVTTLMQQVGEELCNDPEYAYQIMEPIEIQGVSQFTDSSVIISARIKTLPLKQWSVRRAYNRLIKKKFDAEGVEMPFPATTVYFGADKAGSIPPVRLSVDVETEAELDPEEGVREEGTHPQTKSGRMETRSRTIPEEYLPGEKEK